MHKCYLMYYVPSALWHSNSSCSFFTDLYFFPATLFPLTLQNILHTRALVQRQVSFKPRPFSRQHPTEGVAFLFWVGVFLRKRECESRHISESRGNLIQNFLLFHTLPLQTHRSCSMSEIN